MTISPIAYNDSEEHAYARYLQVCDEIEAYQLEHGLDVPSWLWEKQHEAHDRWLHKKSPRTRGKSFDPLLFELQLKKFEKQWRKEAEEKENACK